MSTLTSYASAAARDSAAPASSNTGLCIFRSDTKAIEVSDGTNYLTYNNDGSSGSNTHSGLFDGSGDYIQVSSSSSLSIGGTVTITAWIRKDTTGVFGAIVAKRGSTTTNYQLLVRNTNVLSFYQGSSIINDTTALSANTWYHIAVVATSGSTKFYINGELSSSQSGSTITTSSDDLYIGQVLSGSYWDGYMDEIAIYDRALNLTEIENIVDNKIYVEPAALWLLENDVTDSVGTNDGTNNGVTFSTSVKPY